MLNNPMLLWNSWSTAFRRPWCFVHIGGLGWGWVGWGGAGINVHVNLLGKYSRLCVYRSWRSLKEFLPAHMVLKHKDRGHSTMHPSVTQYVFMWCWRCTLDTPDPQRFLEELQQLLWKKRHQQMSAGSAIRFLVSTSFTCMNVCLWLYFDVRCKSRSVVRSSGRLCQLHRDIACGNPGRLQGRLAGCANFIMT